LFCFIILLTESKSVMSKECAECSRPSNNKFFNCAPRMADGRNFTDYRPRCMQAEQPGAPTQANSYEYRQFLIKNADSLMKSNRQEAYKANMCGPCTTPYNQGTMLPEQSIMTCNESTCSSKVVQPNGLGVGRSYGADVNSQKAFLAAKESEQKMLGNLENCCAKPSDDMNYYPFDYNTTGVANSRASVPGGGYPLSATDRA